MLDHHLPVGSLLLKVVVNAHLVGIDGGATDISASGTCYLVARELSLNNIDLAGLAIAGAVGDKQLFQTANAFILEEALKAGIVSIRKGGLKVGDGDLVDVLTRTTEPFLDITGYPEKLKNFWTSSSFQERLKISLRRKCPGLPMLLP